MDELHSFDGAQGTDLACLVCRLKARLGTPKGYLCCVGTSATLGSEEEQEGILKYVDLLFGEPFDKEAVITESKLSAEEFLEGTAISRVDVVSSEKAELLNPESHENYRAYIRSQHELWFGERIGEDYFELDEWRVALKEKLKGHLHFQNLIKALGGKARSLEEILSELEKVTPELRTAGLDYRINLLNSILSLISEARVPEGSDLRDKVDRRVHWEIFSEYGFSARIGRTLEKTSSSVAYLDTDRLEGLVRRIYEPLRNEIGELRELDQAALRRFLVGLIVHLKNQGSVLHHGLETYIQSFGNTFLLKRIPWMPNFGPNKS